MITDPQDMLDWLDKRIADIASFEEIKGAYRKALDRRNAS